VREKPIMARHHRMPSEEAGYTCAVEPTAIDRLLANEEESIYRRSDFANQGLLPAQSGLSAQNKSRLLKDISGHTGFKDRGLLPAHTGHSFT